ncbi:hypothetical protein HPP92_011811 [Vanilla planifolia]|uniref:Uncharacterized protein n=1 Tax=Vanilla planifolia TaxID=51239 RepID=A0A835V359_VANPL|nr:hypothetical protein HPP92_011811 [Vanilla planifolia]
MASLVARVTSLQRRPRDGKAKAARSVMSEKAVMERRQASSNKGVAIKPQQLQAGTNGAGSRWLLGESMALTGRGKSKGVAANGAAAMAGWLSYKDHSQMRRRETEKLDHKTVRQRLILLSLKSGAYKRVWCVEEI